MATLSREGIQALLERLGVESILPSFPAADIHTNPMGIYLSYLAQILAEITGCEPQVAYDSIQWPNELGDLVVPTPRLRIHGKDFQDIVIDIGDQVGGRDNMFFHSTFIIPVQPDTGVW